MTVSWDEIVSMRPMKLSFNETIPHYCDRIQDPRVSMERIFQYLVGLRIHGLQLPFEVQPELVMELLSEPDRHLHIK